MVSEEIHGVVELHRITVPYIGETPSRLNAKRLPWHLYEYKYDDPGEREAETRSQMAGLRCSVNTLPPSHPAICNVFFYLFLSLVFHILFGRLPLSLSLNPLV